jgi:hypothetical protein
VCCAAANAAAGGGSEDAAAHAELGIRDICYITALVYMLLLLVNIM